MRTTLASTAVFVSLLSLACHPAFAAARGGSNYGRNYIVASEELQPWSVGAYYHQRDREVRVGGTGFYPMMELEEYAVYVGYDILPVWTVYASAGESETTFDISDYSEGEMSYGLGTQVNVFDHEIEDPFVMEDRIRINIGGEYIFRESEWLGKDVDYEELTGYATLSIVNDVRGDKTYLPDSIAIFGGPMYSDIRGDDFRDAKDDRWGYVAGLEVFFTKRITANVAYESFEEDGVTVGINLRL